MATPTIHDLFIRKTLTPEQSAVIQGHLASNVTNSTVVSVKSGPVINNTLQTGQHVSVTLSQNKKAVIR